MFIISLADEDPFSISFDLCKQLKSETAVDREFSSTYENLIEELQKFTGDLVSECRNDQEVQTVLNQLKGSSMERGSKMRWPRLQMAIDYKEKMFIASPQVQNMLMSKWLLHRRDWHWQPPLKRVRFVLQLYIFLIMV